MPKWWVRVVGYWLPAGWPAVGWPAVGWPAQVAVRDRLVNSVGVAFAFDFRSSVDLPPNR